MTGFPVLECHFPVLEHPFLVQMVLFCSRTSFFCFRTSLFCFTSSFFYLRTSFSALSCFVLWEGMGQLSKSCCHAVPTLSVLDIELVPGQWRNFCSFVPKICTVPSCWKHYYKLKILGLKICATCCKDRCSKKDTIFLTSLFSIFQRFYMKPRSYGTDKAATHQVRQDLQVLVAVTSVIPSASAVIAQPWPRQWPNNKPLQFMEVSS